MATLNLRKPALRKAESREAPPPDSRVATTT